MKTIITLALALALTATAGNALAASSTCKVTQVKNGTLSLDCGAKGDAFQVGDEVRIKGVGKTQKKAIEGC
jgi:hypothetical protein